MIVVVPEDPLHPQAYPISHENIHAPIPIKCIIYLLEVEEDFVEELLPHFHNMPNQLGLEGGGPCSPTVPEAMKDIVRLYRRPYP